MTYQQCPNLKIATTPDTYSIRMGTETKGDTHGVCRESRDECPGHCERWPKPAVSREEGCPSEQDAADIADWNAHPLPSGRSRILRRYLDGV